MAGEMASDLNSRHGLVGFIAVKCVYDDNIDRRARFDQIEDRPRSPKSFKRRVPSKRGMGDGRRLPGCRRSEEHTSELQSLMRISYAVFCLQKTNTKIITTNTQLQHNSYTTNNC